MTENQSMHSNACNLNYLSVKKSAVHTEKNSYSLETSKNKNQNNVSCKGFTFVWKCNIYKHILYTAIFTTIMQSLNISSQ